MTTSGSVRAAWGAVVLFLAAVQGLSAAPLWLSVTHTTKRGGATYFPEIVKTQAEQATLPTDKSRQRVGFGFSGPTNLHTRHLQFTCRGAAYDVPEPFVDDLLYLGVDSSVRASINGQDAIFAMPGSSGEKVYTAYFHFRAGRFFQRILDYGEGHTIYIRTNDIITGR